MATFNFSTMQMTVKIVYYGPGLCGKTTNLEHIYRHTTPTSRGEMVSLETKTDRTLFFDLLPLEVGTIAGFKTKIQLYTVPGQVFYNTTRKLVLKGVDGVVFVADSQKALLSSNIESLANLGDNLAELGIAIDGIPLVFQYNKQDLREICTSEELDKVLNQRNVPSVEASALTGAGVFETLRAVSRETLGALKRQLEEAPPSRQRDGRTVAQRTASPVSTVAAQADAEAAKLEVPAGIAAAAVASSSPAATQSKLGTPPSNGGSPPSRTLPSDGDGALSRDLLLALARPDLDRARHLTMTLRIEDEQSRLVHEVQDLKIELHDSPEESGRVVRLNIKLDAEG